MSEMLTRSSGSWAWLTVGALALGGYLIVVAPAERKLQEIRAQAHDLYDLAIRNEHLLRGAAGLSAARDRVAVDVARLAGQRGAGSATLRTLQMLQREGSRAHVTIGSLAPDAPDSTAQNGSEDVTIAMRGTYRNVLSAIADVSRHDVLLEVSGATLATAEAGADEIDATLHATLYYRLDALAKEKHDETLEPH
jgi:hypothetical protein